MTPDWQTWPSHVRHDVIQDVIKGSRTVAGGQLFADYPHIPRDPAERRRKMKTGEIEPVAIH
jgi:hypothetical protein